MSIFSGSGSDTNFYPSSIHPMAKSERKSAKKCSYQRLGTSADKSERFVAERHYAHGDKEECACEIGNNDSSEQQSELEERAISANNDERPCKVGLFERIRARVRAKSRHHQRLRR